MASAAKILNRERLAAKLKAIPDAAKARIRGAMEQSAEEIVETMRSLVAVESGAVRASIGWTWGRAPKDAMIVAKVSDGGELTITVFAGNDKAWYARLVEFGTAAHVNAGRFAGSKHPGTLAQPFFFVAFRANRKKAKSRIARAVTRAAKDVVAGKTG